VARATLDSCPVCQRPLPDFRGWPAWCPACGWGLDPDTPTVAHTLAGLAGWWQRRMAGAQDAELRRLLADPALLARRHPRSAAVLAAAVGVHLVTLALLAAGVSVMTTGIVPVLKVFAGILAFGLVAVTFPLHRLRPSGAAKRGAAPATLAVAATLAKAVGVRAPARVRATSYADPPSAAPGRVLNVDVDRWELLGTRGRVALLAHELAHHNGHDPNRTLLVALAAETLDGWLALLRPDPHARRRRKRRVRVYGATIDAPAPNLHMAWTEFLLPIVVSPVYAVVVGLGWVLREFGSAAGLRAELYADALAAKVGGDVTELVDGELAEAAAAAGNTATPLAALPDAERERRRRLAVAAGTRFDASHPTYAARLEMLAAAPESSREAPVAVSDADLDAITRELVALRRPNE
jgi:Zn-dependent protease with chaperone function